MFPSIEVFGKEIGMYTIFGLIGVFSAGVFATVMTKKRGHDYADMIILLLIVAVGMFITSHLLYGITNLPLVIRLFDAIGRISFIDFIRTLGVLFGGMVFYGSLIGGIFAGWIYMKKTKLPMNDFSDIIAPSIPLFHAFGRIGCFLGGCCYGVESSVGFIYHNSIIEEANGVMRFPIQLVESGVNFTLFAVLTVLLCKEKAKGKLLCCYLLSYSVCRFILEYFRGDDYRGFVFEGAFRMSTSQFISVILLVVTIVFLAVRKYKSRTLSNE